MTQLFVRPCRGIVCNVLTVFLLTACSFGSALAQQWETVKMYDFSDPAFNAQLGGVDGFEAGGYTLVGNGASGDPTDRCGRSNLQNAYIAMQQPLTAGTTYRLSVNAKTNTGCRLNFRYGNAPCLAASGEIQSQVQVGLVSANTDPGIDIITTTFTVDTDGDYWLVVIKTLGVVWLDNFALERQPPALPSFSVTMPGSSTLVSTASVAPSGSLELCLTPEEPLAMPTTVDVAINGDGMPHFPDYAQSLDFPAGDPVPQCFTLSPTADTTSGSYNFEATIGGGSEAVSAFTVSVEGCPGIAGPDWLICEGKSVQLGTGCLPSPHPKEGVEYCYLWEPAEGLDDPSSSMPKAKPSSSTAYFVYVTTSEGAFVGQDYALVEIEHSTVEITASDLIVCDGQSTTLSVTPNEGDTYKWYHEGVLIDGANSPDVVVDAAGEYTVEVTAADGCIARGSITIGDSSDPASQADALKQEGFICIGVTVEEGVVGLRSSTCDTYVDDRTGGISFSFSGVGETITDIACTLDQFLAEAEVCGDDLQGLITKESNVCGETSFFESNAAAFESADAGVWLHFIDFPGEEDCLLIRVNSGEEVQTGSDEAYMSSLLDIVADDAELYGYASKSEQMIDILFNETTVVSFDSIPDNAAQVDNLLQSVLPSPDVVLPIPPRGPCNHTDPVVGVSPSGMPVWVPSGARLSFGLPAKFRPLIDNEALIAFTANEPDGPKGRFVAMGKKCQGEYKFIGYKNQLSPKDVYDFDTANLGSSPAKAAFGTRKRLGCPNAYISVTFKNYPFDPATVDNTAIGSGDLVSEFVGTEDYIFQEGEQGPYGIYLCPSDISYNSFNNQYPVDLEPDFHPPGQANGWMFVVKDAQDELAYIYANVDPTGDGFQYQRYGCDGSWYDWEPPGHPELYDFLSALVQAIFTLPEAQDIIADIDGHLVLDLLGVTPIGPVADGVNAVWYAAEGDVFNASLSAASVFVDVAVTYRLGKVILRLAGETANEFIAVFKIVSGNTAVYKNIKAVKQINKMRAAGFSEAEASRCWKWMAGLISNSSQHTGILLKLIEEGNEKVYKVWQKATRHNNLTDSEITELFKDITDDVVESFNNATPSVSDDFLDFFANNSKGIPTWKACKLDANKRKNLTWLQKLAEASGTYKIADELPAGVNLTTDATGPGGTNAVSFWSDFTNLNLFYEQGDYIFKYDYIEGTLLIVNKVDGRIIGLYEGSNNLSRVVYEMNPSQVVSKLKRYHGLSGPNAPIINIPFWSNFVLSSTPGVTTTIIGKGLEYANGIPQLTGPMVAIIDELLGGMSTLKRGAKPEGFNVLNIPDEAWQNLSNADFWGNFNLPWLQAAISRGTDKIVPASDPTVLNNLFSSLPDIDIPPAVAEGNPTAIAMFLSSLPTNNIEDLTLFGREVKLLSENGYTFDIVSTQFTK